MNYNEEIIKLSKFRSNIRSAKTIRKCFIDGCEGKAINAHSIQKEGALSLISSKVKSNRIVYWIKEVYQKEENVFFLRPIGPLKASTFNGFCSKHDQSIFQDIEQDPDEIDITNLKHLFLLNFRAFALSYHRKLEDVHLLNTISDQLKQELMLRYGFENEEEFQEDLNGCEISLNELNPRKDFFIQKEKNNEYDCLYYFAFEIDSTVNFTSTMVTNPPFFFDGEVFNMGNDPKEEYTDIISTVIPLKNKSIVVLATYKDSTKGIKYINEIKNLSSEEREIAITWHVLTNCENIFFSPAWFDKLEQDKQDLIIQLYLDAKCRDLKTPYLKFDKDEFKLNFFKN